MPRERSTAVMVIAILHLVGGGIGLIASFCAGGWLFLVLAIPGGPRSVDSEPEPPEIHAYLQANVPGYMAFQAGTLLAGIAFDVLLLSAGVGLLNRQPWARWASIVWAALSILTRIVTVVYLFAAVYPAMKALLAPSMRTMPPADQSVNVLGLMCAYFNVPCIQMPFVIYPIVVLIVMFLPSVARSFDHADEPRRREDEDDRDGGRRRRREDEDDEGRWRDIIRERWRDRS